MKFLPALVAFVSIVAGWLGFTPWIVPVLAVVNTGLVARMRLTQIEQTPQRVGKPNMIVEGAYLLILQVLILGAAWILGYFLGNSL